MQTFFHLSLYTDTAPPEHLVAFLGKEGFVFINPSHIAETSVNSR
ncbi:hypothetical protein HNP69_000393 [Chryseobacterium koreense]|nr:hypothetical protein [Chryseobacterium koreense]